MSDDRAAIDELMQSSKPGQPHVLRHYLYFPTERLAESVATELRQRGFRIEQRVGGDGSNWLVLARHEMVPSYAAVHATRQLMESLVETAKGEYDGWEADVK